MQGIMETTDNGLPFDEIVPVQPKTRCSALTRAGTRCTRSAVPGYQYCGAHLRSAEEAMRIEDSGRYGGSLSGKRADAYKSALQDHYLLHLRDEIAVLTARINDLLEQTEEGVNAKTWKETQQLWARFARAYRRDDRDAMDEMVVRLTELIETGKRDSDIWTDVERLFEQRRKLVETEQRHLNSTGQTMTAEAALVMIAAAINALKESVKKYVANRELQQAIIVDAQYEYAKVVGAIGSGEGA